MRFAGVALALLATAASAEPRIERFEVALPDGRELSVQLRKPADAQGRLPAIMLFGGFQRGGRVLDLIKSQHRMIWVNFDYPYEAPRKFSLRSLLEARKMREAIHGTFDGVVALHEHLRKRSDVDPSRIVVAGASAGAPFAVVGGARGKVPGVILVQGFAEVPDVITNIIARKHRRKYGDWILYPARWFARWVTWYCEIPDIGAWARKMSAGQKVLLISAEDDDYVPRHASDALWSALQESGAQSERIMQPGLHLRPDKEGEVERILEPALAWMALNGLM